MLIKGFNSLWLTLLLLFLPLAVMAQEASLDPAAAALEKTAKELEKEIIAPCCWTNPISEHHSEISYQLRQRIRNYLAEGESVETIKQKFVAEYGERILAKPRAAGFNLLVWTVPPLLLLLVLSLAISYVKKMLRQPAAVVEAPTIATLSNDEKISGRQAVQKELNKLDSIG